MNFHILLKAYGHQVRTNFFRFRTEDFWPFAITTTMIWRNPLEIWSFITEIFIRMWCLPYRPFWTPSFETAHFKRIWRLYSYYFHLYLSFFRLFWSASRNTCFHRLCIWICFYFSNGFFCTQNCLWVHYFACGFFIAAIMINQIIPNWIDIRIHFSSEHKLVRIILPLTNCACATECERSRACLVGPR